MNRGSTESDSSKHSTKATGAVRGVAIVMAVLAVIAWALTWRDQTRPPWYILIPAAGGTFLIVQVAVFGRLPAWLERRFSERKH